MKNFVSTIFVFFAAIPAVAGITYKGKLKDPSNVAYTGSHNVRVTIKAGICNSYVEDISAVAFDGPAGGAFTLNIGSGTVSTGTTLENGLDTTSTSPCPANATRTMYIQVNPLSSGPMFGPVELTSSPSAIVAHNAQRLGDKHSIASVLKVEDSGTPGTATAITSTDFTKLTDLIAGTSSMYTKSGQILGSSLTAPSVGNNGQSIRWNGTGWEYFTPAAGISSVVGTANQIDVNTSSGTATVSLPSIAGLTAGTYGTSTAIPILTLDAKGRVTSVTTAAPALTGTAGGDLAGTYPNPTLANSSVTTARINDSAVTTAKIQDGTIDGADLNAAINVMTTGNVSATGSTFKTLNLLDSDSSNKITLAAPTTVLTDLSWQLPSVDGTAGQFLQWNSGGNLSWGSAPAASPGGSSGQIQFNNTSSFAGATNLNWDNGANKLKIGGNSSNPPTYTFNNTSGGTNNKLKQIQMAGTGELVITARNDADSASAGTLLAVSGGSTNARIGIGIATPSKTIQITTNETNGGEIEIDSMMPGGRAYGMISTTSSHGSGGGKFMVVDNTASATPRFVINSSGNVGIGTTTPNSPLDVKGAIRMSGSTSGFAGFQPAAVAGSTVWTLPATDGTSNQVLTTNGSGVLSWSTPAGGLAAVTGTATLTNGKIWAGNGSNLAQEVSLSGDATMTNAGALTISAAAVTFAKMQNITTNKLIGRSTAGSGSPEEITIGSGLNLTSGTLSTTNSGTVTNVTGSGVLSVTNGTTTPAVSISAGAATGQVLRWSAASSDWTKSKLLYTDLINGFGVTPWPSTCASDEALSYSTVTDNFTCASLSAAGAIFNGGNSLGTPVTIGTTDNFRLTFKTNNTDVMTISPAGNVGIGTLNPSTDLAFDGNSTRMISSERHTTTNTQGNFLNVRAGGATTGATDKNGGTLNLMGGIATGSGHSKVVIQVASPGGSSTTDTFPAPFATFNGATKSLEVNGSIVSNPSIPYTYSGSDVIDFAGTNIRHTTSQCRTYNLHNLKDGGTYTFIVQSSTSATCSFNAYSDAGSTSLTVKMPPDHGATVAAKDTLYSFIVAGNKVYVTWSPEY